MKTQTPLFAKLETAEVDSLVKEVKETIATDPLAINNRRSFSTVDFWKVQKMARPRASRRFLV
jgi:hypothetical protein